MTEPTTLPCETVEFHRFGDASFTLLSPSGRYIRTTGWDEPAQELSPTLDHRALMVALGKLRYRENTTEVQSAAALQSLAAEAMRFIPPDAAGGARLMQLDIVSNSAELWAFPFEAIHAALPESLQTECGLIVTRRIRGGFEPTLQSWPDRPKVLYAHAAIDDDLDDKLVAAHARALREALAPWGDSADELENLLAVREVNSVDALTKACVETRPTMVHLLAHGALTLSDPDLPQERMWGVRLAPRGAPGAAPERIAQALRAGGNPVVATLAVCDSANQADVQFARRSLVQELHREGLPVVVGSQFPLTQPGSVTLASAFYRRLLVGDDVRLAVHDARVALRAQADAGHDWVSLVAYVRLPPEGYAKHLAEFGLRVELAMLDAAHSAAGRLSVQGDASHVAAYDAIAQRLRDRISRLQALERRVGERQRDEWHGLLGSACKRLAELLFQRAKACPTAAASDGDEARRMLTLARGHYAEGFRRHIHSHWLGVQQLALSAVLDGTCSSGDWQVVARGAEFARDIGAADVWSCGTLAEACLLAPLAGLRSHADEAVQALRTLVARVPLDARNAYAIASTRRQLERYANWWTNDHGFFPGRRDVAVEARALLQDLLAAEQAAVSRANGGIR